MVCDKRGTVLFTVSVTHFKIGGKITWLGLPQIRNLTDFGPFPVEIRLNKSRRSKSQIKIPRLLPSRPVLRSSEVQKTYLKDRWSEYTAVVREADEFFRVFAEADDKRGYDQNKGEIR